MTAWNPQANDLFLKVLDLPSAAEREKYLDACGVDAALRADVESLLEASARAGSFLENPVRALGATVHSPIAERPGAVIGPYKLLEQIGEGGMGLVFVAEQTQPIRRKVALKVIKPGMDTRQVIARFEAERQALAMMDHPNIAKVLDAGMTDAGRPYFVMELVHGVPITDYCDQARFTVRQRLEVFLQVCRAVQHAHTKGIIHRDLKPNNVLVTSHDGVAVPMVIDFGVAKAMGPQLSEQTIHTGIAQMIGTPLYMSPEQAEFNQIGVDTRSDIYSLGVLLYELLTGATPFDQERLRTVKFDELRRILCDEEPRRPSDRLSTVGGDLSTTSERRGVDPRELTRTLRGELDWIVLRALEKDRTRRYETASAFAADVQRYLNDEAVEACPPSTGYRLRKLARQHRRPLAMAGITVFALVTATAVSAWQADIAWDAQRQAEVDRDKAQAAEREAKKNEDRARKAEIRAATQGAIARAVNDFLQGDLIGQVTSLPEFDEMSAGNSNLTVREALDRASAKIGDRFRDQPLVEAAIRMTIGRAYNQLYWNGNGLAVPHLERALKLRQDHLGPDHPETLDSMARLAAAYQLVGRHREAIALLEQRLNSGKATFGPDHSETLEFAAGLAFAHWYAGKWDLSVPLYNQILDKQRTIFGPTHPATLANMHGLAMNHMDMGQFKDSMSLHAKVLDGHVATHDPRHDRTNWTRMTFAQACQRAGDLDRADQLLCETLEFLTEKEDSLPRRGQRANALGWLALNRLLQERYVDAEQFAREASAIDYRENFRHFYWTSVLGAALLGQKKYDDAESLLLKGYQGMKQWETGRIEGERRRLLTDAGEWVVRYYEETNQPDKAREWREKLPKDRTKK
jgi:eukaryotic-like serine/threonine-protein kinase